MKTLIIDGCTGTRAELKDCLAALGHADVDEAANAEEAKSRIESGAPGLILLDRGEPDSGGLAFLRAFRKGGGASRVILLSTDATRSGVTEAIRCGADGYVLKPFTPDVVASHILRVLGRSDSA